MNDFRLLYFGFINATHPQILRKIQQQYLAAKKLHPDTACLVLGIGEDGFDRSAYAFEFVDVRDFGPVHEVDKGALAARLIRAARPDVVYMRYPIADHHLLELTRRVDTIVFEHQSKELLELRSAESPLLRQEEIFGTRCIARAMGIVGATRDIVDWELERIGEKKPWHVLPNGIDPDSLPPCGRNFGARIELLALADFRIWHGLDRFIRGMAVYRGPRELHVHVAGKGPELDRYAALIAELGLERNFTFHGYLDKERITEISERCQVVLGALAHHRIGLTELCSLKNREYCLRGMPFVFACKDPDFPPDLDFVVNVPGDESPVDVGPVVALAERNEADPAFSARIRQYAVDHLSWEKKSVGLLRFLGRLAEARRERTAVASDRTTAAQDRAVVAPAAAVPREETPQAATAMPAAARRPAFPPFSMGRTARPLNVLFVQNAPCIRNYKMATALRARGHRVSLAYTLKRLSERYPGLSDATYDANILVTSYRQLWDLTRGYDLVHCHNEPDDLTVAALAGDAPVIHDTHDLISLRAGGDASLAYLEGVANRGAAGRIYTTPFQEREARAMYGVAGPSLVFHNYASEANLPETWLPKLSAADGRTHVVYEGGVGGNAHRDFRDVFVAMAARGLAVHIYPAAWRQELANFFARVDGVEYHEPVSPKILIREMSRYDFGVIPWNVEKGNRRFLDSTIANKLFEYQAAGLPVAATRLESYADWFAAHPTGVTFETVDELVTLLPRLRELAATVDYAAELRTFERNIHEVETFYYRIADGSSRAGIAARPAPALRQVPGLREAPAVRAERTAQGAAGVPTRRDVAAAPGTPPDRPASALVAPPLAHGDDPEMAAACARLVGWLDANGWDGWDPYDLPDYLLQREKAGNVLSENVKNDYNTLEKLDPVGLRKRLKIAPKRIPKGLGLLLGARVRLYRATGDATHLDEAERLADWLLEHPSAGYENLCWGYPFDWQSQILIPRDTPSVVVSAVVGDGLWQLWTVTREKRLLHACGSICRFVTEDLHRDDMGAQGVCFSYTPIDDFHVHNANLLGAEFLARMGRETGRGDWTELASRAADYALAEQNADGSIFYWGRKQDYVPRHLDHYHSGFEIRALHGLWHHLGREDLRGAYLRYLDFWKRTYVRADGAPVSRPGAPFPVNIHGAAEGALLCATLAPEHPELLATGRDILAWTAAHMQHAEGWFGHLWSPEAGPGKPENGMDIPHLRWGQGWMLRALAEYFCARRVLSGEWGHRAPAGDAPGRKADPDAALRTAAGRLREARELAALARSYAATGDGAVPDFLRRRIEALATAGEPGTTPPPPPAAAAVRTVADAPSATAESPRAATDASSATAESHKTATDRAQAAPRPPRAQLVMPDSGGHAYGSRAWAETLFAGADSDPWGHDWRASQQARYNAALELAARHVPPESVAHLLDVGCALGHFTLRLQNLFPAGDILGVDISAEAVRKCAALHRDARLRFERAELPGLVVPLNGASARGGFDFVSALEVVYYVGEERIEPSIDRLWQVTAPGGWLLASTYLGRGPFPTPEVFLRRIGRRFRVVDSVLRHHQVYNKFEATVRNFLKEIEANPALADSAAAREFVRSGMSMLGDLEIMERLNAVGRAQGAAGLSHCIVLARKDESAPRTGEDR
ncbi:MAG: glycosyltransferase [Desulfovibrionaceae bacterium]|nr:glycosyltransferase [Desulfovibrionaceae bacterium]